MNDDINKIYENQLENLCLNNPIINFKKLADIEEELINKDIYIPNLLRSFLSMEYYSNLRRSNFFEDVLVEMDKTRKQGLYSDFVEFINWVDLHQEYKDLLDEQKVKKWGDKIEVLSSLFKIKL